MIKIDKSRFTAEQRAQYEALLAVGMVDTAANDNPTPAPAAPTVQKSANELALETALAEVQELKKSLEMQEFTDIAKKYAILGKKEDELAQTLYNLKKSDENTYNAFVGLLDEQLALTEKSGIFGEIGKSVGAYGTASSAEAKIEAKANEIQKADPTIDRVTAIAKAWEESPELMDEYDNELNG